MRILRLAHVLERTGIRAKSTVYRWIRAGRFPAPVRLGPGLIGWPEHEVEAWLRERLNERVDGS